MKVYIVTAMWYGKGPIFVYKTKVQAEEQVANLKAGNMGSNIKLLEREVK